MLERYSGSLVWKQKASGDGVEMENIVSFSRMKNGIEISCRIICVGKDLLVEVSGGDAPHVGSVVVAEPRPSLTGEGVSVTSSVINRIGHKDEAVARDIAEMLAKLYDSVVVCACGIHINNATQEDIKNVMELADALKNEIRGNCHIHAT